MSVVAADSLTLLPARRCARADRVRARAARRTRLTRWAARPARAIGNWAASLIALMALAVFFGLAIGPHLFGYRTATMLTGSMVPQISPGDIVVDTEEPLRNLTVGDVITYHIPVEDHRIVSHRVIDITTNANGSTSVRTKGDANPVEDPWTATIAGNEIWVVRGVVPKVGWGIQFLRRPVVNAALRYGASGMVVLLGLITIWGRSEPRAGKAG